MGRENADSLNQWLRLAESSGIKFIEKFAEFLRLDIKTVYNVIKDSLRNRLLEGTVNKIKSIKRQMYGRPSVNLLTRKILYAITGQTRCTQNEEELRFFM